jgi:hypothetical protein
MKKTNLFFFLLLVFGLIAINAVTPVTPNSTYPYYPNYSYIDANYIEKIQTFAPLFRKENLTLRELNLNFNKLMLESKAEYLSCRIDFHINMIDSFLQSDQISPEAKENLKNLKEKLLEKKEKLIQISNYSYINSTQFNNFVQSNLKEEMQKAVRLFSSWKNMTNTTNKTRLAITLRERYKENKAILEQCEKEKKERFMQISSARQMIKRDIENMGLIKNYLEKNYPADSKTKDYIEKIKNLTEKDELTMKRIKEMIENKEREKNQTISNIKR